MLKKRAAIPIKCKWILSNSNLVFKNMEDRSFTKGNGVDNFVSE